ncbi:HlyD family type I secretion periplasmic adaptor subunit [Halomonas sp. EGI 63088]|uniref:Membrane fusion protein (MFP) family protein n=1 Tax=Halomonas flagellata TaxID=2920385 RepID=A0ABS9RYR9_9GAMM|nr:HlyD family type I secretion periplasmic adaptor subunit [Halomonas flagellata]MCH4564985.1 HlyD family type I secretion periplasmic adaptor subunit [Halomonas flagellata]
MNHPTPASSVKARPTTLPLADQACCRWGMALLLVAFGGFGGWALSADLAVVVVAPGSLSVESFKKTIQHLEGGIVERILVEDGHGVDAGEPLLVIDDTQVRAALQIAQSQYAIARAREVRLLAEQAGEATLAFPQDLIDVGSSRVAEVIRVQGRLFHARRESLRGALLSLDAQVVQMQEQIAGLETKDRIMLQRIDSLSREAADHRALLRQRLGNNVRLREVERQMLEFESEMAEDRARVASLKAQIGETLQNKEVRLQEYQQEVGERLWDVQTLVMDAEERIAALQDEARRTLVTAPVAGIVVDLKVHTLGAVVGPGDPLLDIVPSGDGLVVEARVVDRDVDNVYVGQSAEIRFSAFNQRLSNVIEGRVVHVSADSFLDEATSTRYYRVRVQVTERGRDDMTDNMQLLSGMPAEVMLRTGERTLASYIAKPINDMLARAMRED